MKVSSMISFGLAMTVVAGAAFAGPVKNVQIQKMGAPTKLEPNQVRGVRYVDGKIVGTTPWKAYVPGNGGQTDAPTYAFDAYDSGSNSPGGLPNGNRYTLLWVNGGPTDYVSPVRRSDMVLAPGFNGATSQQADVLFFLGDQSQPFGNAGFFYALFTTEDALDPTCPDAGTIYDGVQFSFTPTDGFYYSNFDVSTDPTLFWQLPMDGSGSTLVVMTQDAGGTTLALGQTGLWCTGEDEKPAEARAGTNDVAEGTDESTPPQCGALNKATNIPNGIIELACECFDFTFGGAVPEATNLTSSIAFAAEGGAVCYPDCDLSNSLDIDDFICFQTLFALGDPYADCDLDTVLTIDDFICFQTTFAVGC